MKIVKKNRTYFLNFENDNESKDLDNYTNKDLEIKVIANNVISFIVNDTAREKDWVRAHRNNVSGTPENAFSERDRNQLSETGSVGHPVSAKSKQPSSKEETKRKILAILQDKDLPFKDKVEGAFEELLKTEDLEVFKEMIKSKEIITYKQSEKYKKAIYVVNEESITQENPISDNKETTTKKQTPVIENSDAIIKDFLKKRYSIIKTLEAADRFSREFYPKFKNNEIKGQKSFDGQFYVIDVMLYNNTRKQILSSGLEKNFSIEDLEKKTNKDTDQLKITIEFLKEEGIIIEKRKNTYCLV